MPMPVCHSSRVALFLIAVRLGLRHVAPAIDGHGDFEEAASTALLATVVALVLLAARRAGTTRPDPWRSAYVALVVAAAGTTLAFVADVGIHPLRRGTPWTWLERWYHLRRGW